MTLEELKEEAHKELISAQKARAVFNYSGGLDSTAVYYLLKEFNINIDTIVFNKSVENHHNIDMIDKVAKEFKNKIELKGYIPYKKIVHEYGHPIKNKAFSELCYRVRKVDEKNYKDVFKVITGHKIENIEKGVFKTPTSLMYLPLKYWHLAKNYPIQTSCCRILKKAPAKKIHRPHILGIMKSDSFQRSRTILKNGKDFYPLSNWTKEDVKLYLKGKEYSKAYKDRVLPSGEIIVGATNTGCIGCHYGNTVEQYYIDTRGIKHKTTKFDNLKRENPRMFNNIMNYRHKSGITFKETLEAYEKSHNEEFILESIEARNWYILEVVKYLKNKTKAREFIMQLYNSDKNPNHITKIEK